MIVFLDIDGVVLPVGAVGDADVAAIFRDPDAHFDLLVAGHSREAVGHLKALLEATGGKLVLHSSWRRFFAPKYTQRFLRAIGLGKEFFHESYAAPMKFSSHKPHDIGMWLDDNPTVREIIVIDDQEFPVYGDRDHGVVTVNRITPISNKGLTADDVSPFLKRSAA